MAMHINTNNLTRMDINNPVVKLCAEGMQAETEGNRDLARDLFQQAWDARTNDYDACVAAHYLARHQPKPEQTLHWNQCSLEHADRIEDGSVAGFYASLHLNVGHSYEELGDRDAARRHYDLALASLEDVEPGPYVTMVRRGVENAMQRIHQTI